MTMRERIEQFRGWATTIAVAIQLAIMLIKGGAIIQRMDDYERRLGSVEQAGSRGLQVHERVDEERVGDMRVQIKRLTDITDKQSDISSDVKVIKATMQSDAVMTKMALESLQKQIELITVPRTIKP